MAPLPESCCHCYALGERMAKAFRLGATSLAKVSIRNREWRRGPRRDEEGPFWVTMIIIIILLILRAQWPVVGPP